MAILNNSNISVKNSFSKKHIASKYFNDTVKIRGAALFSILQENWTHDNPDFVGLSGAIITSISAGVSIIFIEELMLIWKVVIVVIAFITLVLSVIKLITCSKEWQEKKCITPDSVFLDILGLQEKRK